MMNTADWSENVPKLGLFPAGCIWVGHGQRVQLTGVTSLPVDARGPILHLHNERETTSDAKFQL